jgi:RHS repeat-associated protein
VTNGSQYLSSSEIDGEGVCSSLIYDSSGNLQESSLGATISGGNCDAGTSGANTTYGYQGDSGVTSCGGAIGELCTATAPNGTVTNYGYDSLGELTSITQPGGSCTGTRSLCTTFTYQSGTSLVASETNGKDQTSSYTYDNDGNVTQLLSNGATSCVYSSGHCLTEVYDADGNVTSREDKTGTTTYTYDSLGRLTTETLPSDADACVDPPTEETSIIYTWDDASNLVSYCDGGGIVDYTYDPANRSTGIGTGGGTCTGSGAQPCTTYNYNDANQLTGIDWPTTTDATETLSPANNGDPGTIVAESGSTDLVNLTYSYESGSANDMALMQSVDNSVTGIDTSYVYNSQEELTAADQTGTGAVDDSYSYNDENLVTATTGSSSLTLQYNSSDSLCATRPSSFSGCTGLPSNATSYTNDASGNQTASTPPSGSGESISYNPLGQTTSFTPAGGSATTMAYTGVDSTERTQYTTGGVTTYENYNIFGLADTSTTTSVTGGTLTTDNYFTHEPNGTLASMLVTTDNTATDTQTSKRYYYLLDGTNDVVGLMKSDGTSVATYTYGPFGSTTSSGTEASANPFRFQSGYQDPTGYYKFGTRYYNPSVYTWTQPDPDGNRPLYAFDGDNPVNSSDPSGACSGIGCLGYFLLGVDLFGEGVAAAGLAGLVASSSLALELPSFGLTTIGLLASASILAGSGALFYASYNDFAEVF